MDQQPYPGPSLLFHVRTNVMLGILFTIDVLMLDFAIESVRAHGVGGIILFGSEYAILLASLLNSALKYSIMLYDLRRARSRGGEDAPVWENKSMYMFYIELVTGKCSMTCVRLNACNVENHPTNPWALDLLIRLPQADYISYVFHYRHDILRTPAQHYSGCVHDWCFLLHAFPRFTPLPRCYQGHGNQVSRRNGS